MCIDDQDLRFRPIGWAACAKAGFLYASSAFAIGFVFGAIRVLQVAPRLGETVAVLLEAPFMLGVSWMLSRWSASRYGVLTNFKTALLMGAIAFALLMVAEFATAVWLFAQTARSYFIGFASLPGAIGLIAQLCFASFPVLQSSRTRIASGN